MLLKVLALIRRLRDIDCKSKDQRLPDAEAEGQRFKSQRSEGQKDVEFKSRILKLVGSGLKLEDK